MSIKKYAGKCSQQQYLQEPNTKNNTNMLNDEETKKCGVSIIIQP